VQAHFPKYNTNQILMPLIDLKNHRQRRYWNTIHRYNTLEQNCEGKIISKEEIDIVCEKAAEIVTF
jgi:hypothetical protein